MKKLLILSLALLCAAALGGCRAPATNVAGPDSNTTPPPSLEATASPSPDIGSLSVPPELVVSTLNHADSVTAQRYGFSWDRELPNGQRASVIACGIHPLDDPGEGGYATLYTAFPAGSLPPLEEGQLPGTIVPVYYLDFGDFPPDSLTACRWPSAWSGQYENREELEAEEVTVDTIDEGWALFPLGDGEFIYEVQADWGDTGNANYVFATLPQVRGGQ